jgi:hypothetical protein
MQRKVEYHSKVYYEYHIYFDLTYIIIRSSQLTLTPVNDTVSLNNPLTNANA